MRGTPRRTCCARKVGTPPADDWTLGQLREPAQRIADRIEALMNGGAPEAKTP